MLCRGHPSLLTVKVPAHIPSLAAPTTAAALAAAAGACRAPGRPPRHAHLLPRHARQAMYEFSVSHPRVTRAGEPWWIQLIERED